MASEPNKRPNTESLQHEFVHILDSTVIAVIVSDYPNIDSSDEDYEKVRQILAELAGHADEDMIEHDEELISVSNSQLASDAERVSSSETSSMSAWTSDPASNDALRFVETAFPRLPEREVKRVLKDHNSSTGSAGTCIDMDRIIADLLFQEYITDQKERGIDNIDYDASTMAPLCTLILETESCPKESSRKKSGKGRTIRLNDIRQQHHTSPTRKKGKAKENDIHGAVNLNPWAQLSSLSSFFSDLIPNTKPSDFQTHLHKQDYSTPSKAIRAAMDALASSRNTSRQADSNTLVNFLEVLHASNDYYDDLTLEEHDQLIKDSDTALGLCECPDMALTLVNRLIELDMDAITEMSQGLYHSQVGAVSPTPNPIFARTPTTPPHIQPPKDPPLEAGSSKDTGEWITIPMRPTHVPHPYAESIPAYNTAKVANQNTSSQSKYRFYQNQTWRRRKELLQQASHYWRQGPRVGGSKSVGGSIAFFYADRARKLAEESRRWGLKSAVASVEARRSSGPRDVIDLHGLTVEEALVVVQTVLDQGKDGCSQEHPLRVITGAGKHSANKVGVLLPAIHRKLTEDGWDVRKFDAGIIVNGKTVNLNRFR